MKHRYRHLDQQSHKNAKIEFNMEQLAKIVEDCNYGTQRFLSYLVDYRRERYKQQGLTIKDELSDELENLLNRGLY